VAYTIGLLQAVFWGDRVELLRFSRKLV